METKLAPAHDTDKIATQPDPPPYGQGWTAWYLLGVASLGTTIGFFSGNSQSPVIGTLLPLLFALIAGGGGMYLVTVDMTAPNSGKRMRMLGIATFLFSVTTLFGAILGIAIRTENGLAAFLPSWSGSQQASVEKVGTGNIRDSVLLIAMRRKLQELDSSDTEQSAVLNTARIELAAVAERRANQMKAIQQLVSEERSIVAKLGTELQDTRAALLIERISSAATTQEVSSRDETALYNTAVSVNTLGEWLQTYLDDPEIAKLLSKHPGSLALLTSFRKKLSDLYPEIQNRPTSGDLEEVNEILDNSLSTTGNGSQGTGSTSQSRSPLNRQRPAVKK